MRNARRWGLLAALAAVFGATLLVPVAAQAGTYNVYSCSIDGGFYPNNAWVVANNPAGSANYLTDPVCSSAGDPLTSQLIPSPGGSVFPRGTYAGLVFYAPAGTYVSDFKMVAHHYWYAPGATISGTKYPDETTYDALALAQPGYPDSDLFSFAGQYSSAEQSAAASDGHWWGNGHAADTGVITATRATFPHSQAQPQPTVFSASVGCWAGTPTGDCTLARNDAPGGITANVDIELYGARMTIHDDTSPDLTGPAPGQGLRESGTRSGSESVTFSASDNVGVRMAELVDVTDAANPQVVAAKDFNSGTLTAQQTRCDFTRPLPCPNLSGESLTASPPIAGHRTLLLRVTDAAGNETNSAPFALYARGSANGTNVTDTASLTAGFPAKVYRRSKAGKRYYTYVLRPARTVSYGKGGTLRGILRNADGQPVTGADVRILVRENRTGAQYVDRGGLTTGADGRVSLGIPAGSSRIYQLTYKAYVGDDNLAARSKATLNTRARITAHAPRRVRGRGTARFRGTLVGRPRPRRGVTLELQAYQPRRGWRTVGTARTGKNGRYSVRYKFNSRSGSFRFRMRLRPNDAYPYARGTSKRLRVRVG